MNKFVILSTIIFISFQGFGAELKSFKGVKTDTGIEESTEAQISDIKNTQDFCCDRPHKGGSFAEMSERDVHNLLGIGSGRQKTISPQDTSGQK